MTPREIEHLFYDFVPSKRLLLKEELSTIEGEEKVFEAIQNYVEIWERHDWLDENEIERIGKWFGIIATNEFLLKLIIWTGDSNTPVRIALLNGIVRGMGLSDEEKKNIT